ncbi:hypothetical protein E4U27_005315 [Claviceps purpurea]|nr:hypothetical protein E4U27_005315 [Claviceps purpurea]
MGGVDRWGRLDERDPRHWIVRVGAGVASHGRAKRRAASRGRVTTWECRTLQLAGLERRPAEGVGTRPAPAKLHLGWAQKAAVLVLRAAGSVRVLGAGVQNIGCATETGSGH